MAGTILLADDSLTIQKVVELTFADTGFSVVAVSTGDELLQRLPQVRPDVIICDVIMPGRDGYDVCQQVKSNPSTLHIPVVLLTGTFEPFDRDRALAAGCSEIISKPFEARKLVEIVERLGREGIGAQALPVETPVEGAVRPPLQQLPPAPPVQPFSVFAPPPFTEQPVPPPPPITPPEEDYGTRMAKSEPQPPLFDEPAEAPQPLAAPAEASSPPVSVAEELDFTGSGFAEMEAAGQAGATERPEIPENGLEYEREEQPPADHEASLPAWQEAAPQEAAPSWTAAAEPETTAEPAWAEAEPETAAEPAPALEPAWGGAEPVEATEPVGATKPTAVEEPWAEPPFRGESIWSEQSPDAAEGAVEEEPVESWLERPGEAGAADSEEPFLEPEERVPVIEPWQEAAIGARSAEVESGPFGGELAALAAAEPLGEPEPPAAVEETAPSFPAPTPEEPTFATPPMERLVEREAAPELPAPAEEMAAALPLPVEPFAAPEKPAPEPWTEPRAPAPEMPTESASAAASDEEPEELATELSPPQAEPEVPAEEPAYAADTQPTLVPQPSAPSPTLSDEEVDRIAHRVLELASGLIEQIAWEVIPDMAEIVVRERVRRIEDEVERGSQESLQ